MFPNIEVKAQPINRDCFIFHSLIGKLMNSYDVLNVVSLSFFIDHSYMLGEGGFGKVLTGMLTSNKVWHAVKCINKAEILKHKTGLSMIFGELRALERVAHPFIIPLKFAFQDRFELVILQIQAIVTFLYLESICF